MSPRPPRLLRTLRLLAGINLRRTANRLLVIFTRRTKGKTRKGTAPHAGFGGALLVLVLALCVVNFGFMGYQVFSRIATVAEQEAGDPGDTLAVGRNAYRTLRDMQLEREKMSADSEESGPLIERQLQELREVLPRTIFMIGPDGPSQVGRDEVIRQYRARGLNGFSQSSLLGHSFRTNLWPTTKEAVAGFKIGATLVLSILLIALLLSTLGSGNIDLGRVEWTLEWLFTFPASTRVLMTAKLLEYALVSPILWLAVAPTIGILAFTHGMSFGGALVTAVAGVVVLGLLLASARLTAETALRQRLPLARLKNVQALCTLLGMLGMFVILYLAVAHQAPSWVSASMQHLPASISWLPTGLLVTASSEAAFSTSWALAIAVALAMALAVAAAATSMCTQLLRDGLLVSSNVRTGSRGRTSSDSSFRPLGVLRKELLLLLRDRNFLVQTTVVPVFIIAWQFIANPGLLDSAAQDPRHAAAMAFGVGAYVLMFGAMATFGSEGQALWLLYTLPHRLDVILRKKTLLWAGIALAYTAATLALVFFPTGSIDMNVFLAAAPALIGVAIYAYVAAGMGVLGWAPDLKQTGRRVRSGAAYAYMLLAACYAYGIYAPDPWTRAVVLFLCALLAYALWQKVRDRLPLILDLTELPPPTITLADGVTAAFLFFVLQGLLLLGFAKATGGAPETGAAESAAIGLKTVLLAFASAGLLVMLGTFFVFRRRRMPNILATVGLLPRRPESLAGHPPPGDLPPDGLALGSTSPDHNRPEAERPPMSTGYALVTGVVGGVLCGVLGRLYLIALERVEWLAHLRDRMPKPVSYDTQDQVWIILLAVVAAPVFEEFLFRGLLFQGLRRSFGLVCSLLTSAAVFAVVHPAVSVLPVFAMGLVAALVFERSRSLPAAMTVHAVYNAMVIVSQL